MLTTSSTKRKRGTSSGPARWVGDFETTTTREDCRVWLWGLISIESEDQFIYGTDMDSFVRYISAFDSHVYFQNLAFDGRFIFDWLLKNGYRHVQDRMLRKGEFTSLISSTGKFYSFTVRWKNGRRTEFRDSLKKLPMSVANVAKAFGMEESKLSIDYHVPRPVGYEPTELELDYLYADIIIIVNALRQQLAEGMTRLTVGSDSLAEFKHLTGSKLFQRMYPILPDAMDAEIRRAYRGGFTYVSERHQGKLIGSGTVYDVNSLYPSVMYEKLLPYGEPHFFEGEPHVTEDFPLFITSLTFTARLKKDHIPCIQIKANPFFLPTAYQTVIEEPVTMVCTSVDLALWQDHYDLDILSWNGAWHFRAVSDMFHDYIDKWMGIKNTSKGGLKVIAKLHLNSLYGKFATNPNVTRKVPVLEDDIVKLRLGPEETKDPVYTAVGVFITAYARDLTIRAAQEHYDRFVYADTDSLHLLDDDGESGDVVDETCEVTGCKGHPAKLDVHKDRLGAWKHEVNFKRALYARAKCYTEQLVDDSYVTHIAGLPEDAAAQVRFRDYFHETTLTGKLKPTAVAGGIVLEEVGFTLKNHFTTIQDVEDTSSEESEG